MSIQNVTLEDIVTDINLIDAYKQVRKNKGSAGVDGMDIVQAHDYIMENLENIRKDILEGRYKPQPVRRVFIPKDNGKMRQLGIPTIVDRVIQQAIKQALWYTFEKKFSDSSYGYRPFRSAHDAIKKATEHINNGRTYIVEMDLEKFFDTVNHDRLRQLLSSQICDTRIISLISKFLNAGAMDDRVYEDTYVGVPQGGPLSPLLANIYLDTLDKELEKRGHTFVRYADDLNIFCKSRASAKQTLEHLIPFIEGKLKLKVNREKTKVSKPSRIKFLGYTFGITKKEDGYKPRLHSKSKIKIKEKIREVTQRNTLIEKEQWIEKANQIVRGWTYYFYLAEMKSFLLELDQWFRRRIRMVFLKRWKRAKTKIKNLIKLGLDVDSAKCIGYSRKGYWRLARTHEISKAMSNARLERNGFLFFLPVYTRKIEQETENVVNV